MMNDESLINQLIFFAVAISAKLNEPVLLKQEIHSFSCAIRILFRIYGDSSRRDACVTAEEMLLRYVLP